MSSQLYFRDFQIMSLPNLVNYCKENNITISSLSRQNILLDLLKYFIANNIKFIYSGFLEIVNGYGFLRDIYNSFNIASYDVYVHTKIIKDYDLRNGDEIECIISPPKSDEQKLLSVADITSINGNQNKRQHRPVFEDFTATYPVEQIILGNVKENNEYNKICRVIDIVNPIGRGQRALIVAPPKSGKTSVLHGIAYSILQQYKDIKLIIVLVGERPEEVTEMRSIAPDAEIVASTFDDTPEQNIRTVEIIGERAKRLVENGANVVILMDSITRLVRVYNCTVPSSGRVGTGGIEPLALHKAKKFFGIARNISGGGSLTIIATCLIDTGAKMDESIYEEFKGTGNSEIKLDRKLSEQKIFPAIDIRGSGTRRYEKMLSPEKVQAINLLSTIFGSVTSHEATKLLLEKISQTKNNDEFISSIYKSSMIK